MHIDWTAGAADCLRETLDYWVEHNGSVAYSNKILDEDSKIVIHHFRNSKQQPL